MGVVDGGELGEEKAVEGVRMPVCRERGRGLSSQSSAHTNEIRNRIVPTPT
jgi:hypothetical protein